MRQNPGAFIHGMSHDKLTNHYLCLPNGNISVYGSNGDWTKPRRV
ncbi:hypothetical protein XBFM1_510004 [Xenorhabdus bovienii str. feltiae Moldova]|uniref:Uncharacterized protein n=2 Tax=Xenorhabdus bovienii TaxID=40576 RepID=A0A077PV92_XENBV|nr:hypothetical protein XBFM1_510004 [Xenorhabdus bovienii str. feltiae Moldova]CDH23754.1 hypothetical protein XBKB1_2000001 [Xenorhabdus bovienii str. kraussei Becker Underwood]